MAGAESRGLSPILRVFVLGSGRVGHEVNALGVVEALGGGCEMRRVAPRFVFGRLAPWGPVDPRDGAPFGGPPPDIVIASGRVTVPYAREWKRRGAFVVFLQDPRWARGEMDLIWVPEHDSFRGRNVLATLTSPHPFSPARLAADRAAPDPRLAALPRPRCAVSLGGPSGAQHFTPADHDRLREAIHAIRAQGYSIMATPSRRTSPALAACVRESVGDGFFWDGDGQNPYSSMLALADAVLVTGDSANMVGEATATGAPVHVFEPTGGRSAKLARAIDALEARGAARRWAGRLERFSYAPIDCSGEIAAEILRRYGAARAAA
ncbi:MAG: mitochondrial fission ELM1 family protein [Pseudomonadota bacterium]|nr:mitochondrial fission ELM1 family protein [Pseudomonadota bacterium]